MEQTTTAARAGVAKSFRVTPLCARLLDLLSEAEGVNNTAYLEVAIRRLAQQKGIDVELEKRKMNLQSDTWTDPGARVRRVYIEPSLLLDRGLDTPITIGNPLPDDYQIMKVTWDRSSGMPLAVVRSTHFEPREFNQEFVVHDTKASLGGDSPWMFLRDVRAWMDENGVKLADVVIV